MPENNQDKLRNKFYVSIQTHPVGAYRGELSPNGRRAGSAGVRPCVKTRLP